MDEERTIKRYEKMFSDITLIEFNQLEEMFKEDFDKIKSPTIKRRWKRLIFSLNMADYKKERIWEYLNNDIGKEYFDCFVEGVYAGWFK